MIKITAKFLIERRKQQWECHHDIKKDERFVLGVAPVSYTHLRAHET
mgnify:CR=1 FL=1